MWYIMAWWSWFIICLNAWDYLKAFMTSFGCHALWDIIGDITMEIIWANWFGWILLYLNKIYLNNNLKIYLNWRFYLILVLDIEVRKIKSQIIFLAKRMGIS